MPSGPKNELVGISHECDYPPGGGRLSVLTRPRKALARRSSDIDREVREILRDALAVYEIELERLRAARPDVVVTPDLCDVCAVSIDDVRQALVGRAREDVVVVVVSCKPTRLAHVWGDGRGHSARSPGRSQELRM